MAKNEFYEKKDVSDLRKYDDAVETIKTAILQGQYEAAKGVNRIQLAVYFGIGKYISLHTRKGVWGTGALEVISQRLRKELPGLRGYSPSSMKNMRQFFEEWIMLDAKSPIAIGEIENNKSLVATDDLQTIDNEIDIHHSLCIPDAVSFPIDEFFKVPFTHHSRILAKVKTLDARYYYICRTAEEHLSVDALQSLINVKAYEHRTSLPSNFKQTLSDSNLARKAVMMFKDSYFLDFINVEQIGERESIDVDERVVEQRIIQNVKNFIMTFGHDFAFVGNQYHLEVYGVEHFPDLLFFNRALNALVVIELKTGEFKSSYLGQLMSYLSILDAKVKKPHENPSIGIVLCKSSNREYVEFVIRDYNKPMGVATYKTSADMPEEYRKALPDVEELKRIVQG